MSTRWLALLCILLSLAGLAYAFTDATLREDCNRSENPLTTGWSGKVLAADTNQLQANGTVCLPVSGSGNRSSYTTATYGPDTWVTATVPDATGGATGQTWRLFVRLQSPGLSAQTDGYECRFDPFDDGTPQIRIFKLTNDSIGGALLDTSTVNINDGHKIGCAVTGSSTTTICAWADTGSGWTQVGCGNDSTSPHTAAGNVGIHMNTTLLNIDNIGICTVSGGACLGAAGTRVMVID